MSGPDGMSRRHLLQAGAAGAGVAAAGSLLPPSVHRAMALPVRGGGLRAIEHVIVLMQENRSFDHYFGRLRGVRGFGDSHPLRLRGEATVFAQHDPDGGRVLPFSVREAARRLGRDRSDIQYLGDLDHSFPGSTRAWGQGWNNAWIAAKTAATMTYYDRRDVPLQYELADTFTICDAYHCSVFGSTNPNRNYLWSGTTGYEPRTDKRAVTNAAYSYDHPGYDWTTYPERLEEAGVSWQIYQEWDNFTDNAVEYFTPFKNIGNRMLADVEGEYRTTEEFYYAVLDMSRAKQRDLLAQLAASRARLPRPQRELFDKAMCRSEPDTLVPRLRADIENGTLPAVSWLVPTAVDSEHPGASTPVGSAHLIYRVLDAIASDPETWSTTALLINFDENDGYFDHVPPPVAPRPASGNSDDWYADRPIGLGPRVPMTVVSPWTVGGHVSSEVFDHTSVLQFLEKWTGVREPNISVWRRRACGDLMSAFDFDTPGTPPRVQSPGPVPAEIDRWHPTPPDEQRLPEQERGRRPARPVPYQPFVRAALGGDGRLRVTVGNTGAAAAPFAVYPYAGELPRPRHLLVAPASTTVVETRTPDGGWNLAVQGPNRYWCELVGSVDGAAAGVDVRTQTVALRRKLELTLVNAGDRQVALDVRDLRGDGDTRSIRLRPGQRRSLGWDTDHGWYDVEVTCSNDATFRRRLTGHVENRRPSTTPPR